MKSGLATARRLLDALELFVRQESILLRAGHYAQMAAVQRRAAPLIARLCQLGAEPGVAAVSGRVAALVARRRENISGLVAHRNFLGEERERLAEKRQQVRRLASYGGATPRSIKSRLAATV